MSDKAVALTAGKAFAEAYDQQKRVYEALRLAEKAYTEALILAERTQRVYAEALAQADKT